MSDNGDEQLRLRGGDNAAFAEQDDAELRHLDTVRAEADAVAVAAKQTCAEFGWSQAHASELSAAAECRTAELASPQPAAETEISLLKQENSRLLMELESALKSVKEAQDLLCSQADNARTLMLKDKEFKLLQLQVIQLKEENDHSFEECQKFRAEARKAKMESQRLQSLVLEKEINAEICKEKLEMQKAEIANLNQRISELVENSKGIDLNTFEGMKNELENIKDKELLEKHNLWLDEELKVKVKNLAEIRKTNMDEQAKMSARIAELEREISESSSSLRRAKERISELEQRVSYMEKELCSAKDAAATNAQRLGAELSTIDDTTGYSNEELEHILSQWIENPDCDIPSNIYKINLYDQSVQEIKKYAENGIAYFVLRLTPAKKGGKQGVGFNRKMKCNGRWKQFHTNPGNKSTIKEFSLMEEVHYIEKMLEFSLVNGPQDLVLCKIILNCDSKTFKIRTQSYKEDKTVQNEKEDKCKEQEKQVVEDEKWKEEVQCLKFKLWKAEQEIEEAHKKIQYLEEKLLENQGLIGKIMEVESKLQEAEKKLSEAEDLRRDLHNQIMMLKGNMRVFCRVRPLALNGNINDHEKIIIFPESLALAGRGLKVVHNGDVVSHTFDRVFQDTVSQKTIFGEISELVQSSMDGYKVTIFSYGQTGSGKTYTMIGKPDDKGMIPRALTEIFNKIKASIDWNFNVEASMFEIYNERIFDLLDTTAKKNLDVCTDEHGYAKVPGLGQRPVCDENDAACLFKEALKHRSVGKTQMNENSSRSHFVFKLIISGYNKTSNHKIEGVLQMIDLAGSESVSKTTDVLDVQKKEAGNINKSLLALGQVFEAIPKGGFLPFRGSKLTHFLQNSFEGHSKVLLFVNISQDPTSLHATLGSLNFADKVHKCMIKVPAMQDKSVVHEENEGHNCSKSLFKPKATGQKGRGVGKFGTSLKPPHGSLLYRG